MISTHYMKEIQKDNERNIKRANEFKHFNPHDASKKAGKPGILPLFLNGTGSLLVKIGTRLQGISTYRRASI